MIESQNLKNKGAIWWHTKDSHSPNLTKANLGRFFQAVLSRDVQVGTIWVFDRRYSCSSIYVSVLMTEATKDEIEAETKYMFRPPQKVHLNHTRKP